MNKLKINYFVDAVALISFLVTAVTGLLIFVFLPPAEGKGGAHSTLFGYGRHDWGGIHDWAGVIMIVATIAHIVLHWGWIIGTTKNFLGKRQDSAY